MIHPHTPKWVSKILRDRQRRNKAPICQPGKHVLHVAGILGMDKKELACDVCRYRVDVPMTSTERRTWASKQRIRDSETKGMHTICWAYQKEFYKWEDYRLTEKQYRRELASKKRMGTAGKLWKVKRVHKRHVGFKWSGWELMERLRKFAARHPGVLCLGCDDSYHASSTICLIPHRTKSMYWGTTVVVAPQMGQFGATEVFLYPDHAAELAKALMASVKESRAKKKSERKIDDAGWPGNAVPKGFKAEGL